MSKHSLFSKLLGKLQTLVIILFSLGLLGILVINGLPWLDRAELEALDERQRQWSKVSENRSRAVPLSIIGFDSKTLSNPHLESIFPNMPNRDFFAIAVRFLNRGNPRAVAFDLSFNGEWKRRNNGDTKLIESLQGVNFVGSGMSYTNDPGPEWQWNNLPPDIRQTLRKNSLRLTLNSPQAAAHYRKLLTDRRQLKPPGFQFIRQTPMNYYLTSTVRKTVDGNFREWSPFGPYAGGLYPSLALWSLLDRKHTLSLSPDNILEWGTYKVHLPEKGAPIIKWRGRMTYESLPPSTIAQAFSNGPSRSGIIYPVYSMWDLIESELVLSCRDNPNQEVCHRIPLPKTPRLLPTTFNNRIVLLGFTEMKKGGNAGVDLHPTIYPGGLYPGIYIWANIIDNIVHDDFIQPAPWWLDWGVGLLCCGLLAFFAIRLQANGLSTLLFLSLISGYWSLAYFGFAQYNLWIKVVTPIIGLFLTYILSTIWNYHQSEQRKQQLRFAFGKYVSPSIMHYIEENPDQLHLGGQRKELTMLFCDIRGFTTYSEQTPPEEVQAVLSRYFSQMNRIILHEYNGAINKLIGDAIMAYWGFPVNTENHAYQAVCAALSMKEALITWQQDPNNPPIQIGIGINTGPVMIGNVGSEDFMDFTVIGDAVNLASRLEGLNKTYQTTIIISRATYDLVKDHVEVRSLGSVQVKGKEEIIEIFEPLRLKARD